MTRRVQDACIECGAPASHRLLCETSAELEQYRETVEEKDENDVAAD